MTECKKPVFCLLCCSARGDFFAGCTPRAWRSVSESAVCKENALERDMISVTYDLIMHVMFKKRLDRFSFYI